MKSTADSPYPVSNRPTLWGVKLIGVVFLTASMLIAQSAPAGITTITVPTVGAAIFDAAGNQYYMQGPSTPGSAQPQPANGTCYPGGIGPPVPITCSAAQIVKVDPSGSVVFGTYLGGQTNDSGNALAVDSAGDTFLTGSTGGLLPTTSGSAIPTSTTSTTFAARLSSDGSTFLYVTYLPSTVYITTAIALDSQDNAYITGQTNSGAAIVIKLSPDGSAFLYDNLITPASASPTGSSRGTAIAIDPPGNAIVLGWTSSPNLAVTPGALQSSLTGTRNIFLAKLDPSGNILFASYLGGSGTDSPTALQVDTSGNIYIAGATTSLDFPTTPGTFQPTAMVPLWNNYGPGGFAAKLSSSATQLVWSTYVMSSDYSGLPNGVTQMAVIPSGDVYLAGVTGATFPVTPSAPEVCFAGSFAGFIAHLNPQGALADATYLSNIEVANLASEVNGMFGLTVNSGGQLQAVWQSLDNSSGSSTILGSNIQFGTAGSTAPACLSSTILNAATMNPGSGVAPGEIVTLTGFGIGPAQGVSYTAGPQGQIPTTTGGVQVFFGSTPAPVLYASATQINAIAPTDLTGSASVTVTYNNQQLGPITAPVTFASPGFFRLNAGYSTQAAGINEDGSINGPSNPAPPGSILSLWATGFGPTNPSCTSGELNVPEAAPLAPGVSVLINGGATIIPYAGSSPGLLCGIVQVNMQVWPQTSPGNYFITPSALLTGTLSQAQTGAVVSVQ